MPYIVLMSDRKQELFIDWNITLLKHDRLCNNTFQIEFSTLHLKYTSLYSQLAYECCLLNRGPDVRQTLRKETQLTEKSSHVNGVFFTLTWKLIFMRKLLKLGAPFCLHEFFGLFCFVSLSICNSWKTSQQAAECMIWLHNFTTDVTFSNARLWHFT